MTRSRAPFWSPARFRPARPVAGGWRRLDNQVPAAIQTEILRAIQDLVADGTLWFLRHAPRPLDIAGLTAAYGPGLAALRAHTTHLPASTAATATIARLTEAGVPAELAEAVTAIDVLTAGCDITRLATDKIGRCRRWPRSTPKPAAVSPLAGCAPGPRRCRPTRPGKPKRRANWSMACSPTMPH